MTVLDTHGRLKPIAESCLAKFSSLVVSLLVSSTNHDCTTRGGATGFGEGFGWVTIPILELGRGAGSGRSWQIQNSTINWEVTSSVG